MSEKRILLTIGVYGFSEDEFFNALVEAGVDVFCDVRARRGVRGSTYAFANSQRLQARLQELGIEYRHFKDLAPSQETRDLQKQADKESGTAKRQRTALGEVFINSYHEQQLADFDPETFMSQFGKNVKNLCFFCVERDPAACHRSLIVEKLSKGLGLEVKHIIPQ